MKISARMLSRLIREAVNNLQTEPNSAIVSFAVKKFEGARSDMEQLNRFTPFLGGTRVNTVRCAPRS